MSNASIPRLFRELRRRRVFRAAAVYAAVAWVVVQVAETVIPGLGLPQAWVTLVIVLALLGLPLAVVLSWAYEVAPDGSLRAERPPPPPSGPPLSDRGQPTDTSGNLPRRLTSFVGRQAEVAEVSRLLTPHRLVTLTGLGGVGKTSLALQVAEDAGSRYGDGTRLVDLAPLSDGALVVHRVATVLRIREEAGQPLLETLVRALRAKQMLLVLDNCEHLVAACAEVSEALLRDCPGVTILLTSREKLGITGETTYGLSPLSLPDPADAAPVDHLGRSDAVRLFVDRARAVTPGFALTPRNARAVASVCTQLDGIPLAIELAAARLDSLSPDELSARLEDRFALLSRGSRTAQPRQQTLRALLDWSFDLLSRREKSLLSRLSVFAGGWTLHAAEDVCEGSGIDRTEVLDVLTGLIAKSLVIHEVREPEGRYRMLETVRRYADEHLTGGADADAYRYKHCVYFMRLAAGAQAHLVGPEETAWLERLEREHDNLRLAIRFIATPVSSALSPATPGRADVPELDLAELALEAAHPLARFWRVRGYISEGAARVSSLIELGEARGWSPSLARALHGAGWLARERGDYVAARETFERALLIARAVDDKEYVAWTLIDLGFVARYEGDYVSARQKLEEAQAVASEVGSRPALAASLGNLGLVARDVGDRETADSLLRESLGIARDLGDRLGIAWPLTNLGLLASQRGDLPEARRQLNEALALWRELGDHQNIAYALSNLGGVATQQGDLASAENFLRESLTLLTRAGDKRGIAFVLERSAVLAVTGARPKLALVIAGHAAALRESIGAPQPPALRAAYQEQLEAARRGLAPEDAVDAERNGARLDLDELALVMASTVPTGRD